MAKAAFIKRNGALVPMYNDGREMLAAMKDGRQVMVAVHTPRNVRHHRLLFLLMEMLIDGGAWGGSKEDLLDYLKIAARHVKTIIGADGQTYFVPMSIDFESMDQAAFNRFYDRCLYVVCERLLPGRDWEALRADVVAAADGDLGQRAA